jgi:ribose transport system permease protein
MSTVPAAAVEQPPKGIWPTLVQLQGRLPLLQFAALSGVYVYLAIWHGFSNWSSAKEILVIASLAGLASAGQTLLILMGGFDLSISGFIVSASLVVTVLKDSWHISFAVALLIAVAAGGLLGALAGQICHRFEIQPLIVTLAMGTIALGLVQVQTHGSFSGTAPDWLQHLTSPKTKTFGVIDIPPPVAIWIVVAVLMGLFIHRTPAGRMLLATGANPRAAEYSLISTRRVWTLAFAFSGITAVLVGMLVCGFSGSVDSGIGDPYLFQSVVAVIVGGTVFGGPGDYTRTVIGALFLTFVYETLIANDQGPGVQNMVYGAAILLAVALYGRERRLRDRI